MNHPSSKFALIHKILDNPSNRLTVKELCDLNGVSRSGYYSWVKSREARDLKEEQDRHDFDLILTAYKKGGYAKGAQRIQATLLHMDPPVVMNLKKIRRLMKKYNLSCPIRKANPYRQMQRDLRTSHVAKNKVDRQFEAHGPRKILLTDITYIPYNGKMAYLSTIIDAFTKQILAWVLSDNLEVDFVLETVNQLMAKHGQELSPDTLIHSDQGSHYTSLKFIDILRNKKLVQSMSRKGNCWDNAPQESFFGHMKDEIKGSIKACKEFDEVRTVIANWMHYYNTERYQWRLAKLSPDEFYQYWSTKKYPIENVKIPETKVGKKKPEADSHGIGTSSDAGKNP